MKTRPRILWWPLAVAAVVLAAFCGCVWVIVPHPRSVSGEWEVISLGLPSYALPRPDELLVSDESDRLTYIADGVWTHDLRTGETTRRAPPVGQERYHFHLADAKGNVYAWDHDSPLWHYDAGGNRRKVFERAAISRHDACWGDVAFIDESPSRVVWLSDGRAYSAPAPSTYPTQIDSLHGWKDTLTVCGGGRAVRHRLMTDGETIRFTEENVYQLGGSALTAVDPVSGDLAVLNRSMSGSGLRVISGPGQVAEYLLSGLEHGHPTECVLNSGVLYFTFNTPHYGGLDMVPHSEVYAFRLADRSVHRITAWDSTFIRLLPARSGNGVFASPEGGAFLLRPR